MPAVELKCATRSFLNWVWGIGFGVQASIPRCRQESRHTPIPPYRKTLRVTEKFIRTVTPKDSPFRLLGL